MNESNPVPQVLGMLVFRDYASAADLENTIDCLHIAAGCLELRLARKAEAEQAAIKAGLIARLPPEAQARHAAEAARQADAARPKRKRGRPAKPEAARQAEEAALGEEARQAARLDAARQQAVAGAPTLFADPPQAVAGHVGARTAGGDAGADAARQPSMAAD